MTNIDSILKSRDITLWTKVHLVKAMIFLVVMYGERVRELAQNSTFKKPRSWHLVPSPHGKQMGKQWKQCQTSFSWPPKSLQMVTAAMKLKDAFSLEEKLWPT